MDTHDDKARGRNSQAAEVLRKLDEIGAIKLDVLLSKSAEISGIARVSELEPGDICYPFYLKIGPLRDIDLVSVATQLKQLGFEIRRTGVQTKG